MSDAEAIKAWLDRWDEHQNDNCRCEKCRRKRAILMAVEFIHEVDNPDGEHDGNCPKFHPAFEHKWCNECEATKTLASIRETLVSG